jgi:hypothetical protein
MRKPGYRLRDEAGMSGPECRKSYQINEMRACSRCSNEGTRKQQLRGNEQNRVQE